MNIYKEGEKVREIPENVNNAIQEFIKGTQEILGDKLKKIILYGSYARGDFNEGSDVDIMILTDLYDDELNQKEEKIWDLAYDIEVDKDFTIHISPILINTSYYNDRISIVPFYKNVKNEGVALING